MCPTFNTKTKKCPEIYYFDSYNLSKLSTTNTLVQFTVYDVGSATLRQLLVCISVIVRVLRPNVNE